MKSYWSVREAKHHRKPYDPDRCLESHRTGLISVKTVMAGKKYPRTATKFTYLCTYCMWECDVFLGVLSKRDS